MTETAFSLSARDVAAAAAAMGCAADGCGGGDGLDQWPAARRTNNVSIAVNASFHH